MGAGVYRLTPAASWRESTRNANRFIMLAARMTRIAGTEVFTHEGIAGWPARRRHNGAAGWRLRGGGVVLIRRVLICLTIVALLAISISVGVITADWPRWSRELGLPGPEPAGNPRPSAG